MNKFFKVLKFEYLSTVKNKGFIISMIVTIVLCGIGIFFGITAASSDASEQSAENTEKKVIALYNGADYDKSLAEKTFEEKFKAYELLFTEESSEEIQKKIDDDTYAFGIILNSPLEFTYIHKSNNMMDMTSESIEESVLYMYKVTAMQKQGVTQADYDVIMNAEVKSTVINIHGDNTFMFIVAFIMLMVLYMAILMYGQLVSTSVITEKNSRAMELLISCAKPSDFIFGKVIGSGLAGLTQLSILFLLGGVSISFVNFGDKFNAIIQAFMPQIIKTVGFGLLFFILGFFIYAFLFAAMSSLATRMEDLNTLTSPIAFLYIIAFFLVLIPVMNGNVDGTLATVLSYVPFTAPLEMVVRIAFNNVAAYEVVISIVVQIVSVYLLGRLSAAIYRMGVMMYGKPPKLSEIFNMLRTSKAKKH